MLFFAPARTVDHFPREQVAPLAFWQITGYLAVDIEDRATSSAEPSMYCMSR